MEKLKSYGLAIALCSAALSPLASGETSFQVGVNKYHYFTSQFTSRFGGGDFLVHLRDGNAVLQFCFGFSGFPTPVGIDPLACPLGTTAYIVGGDLDNNGVQDVAGYWSVVNPVPAAYAEPFRADVIKLYAWPGTLPQLQNFKDLSSRIYYNLFAPQTFRQYNISEYEADRPYAAGAAESKDAVGALVQMNKEVPPGQYSFVLPGLKRVESMPDYPVYPTVTVNTFIEAFGQARYGAGFRFTSGTWDPQFYYQMDPRLTTKFVWTGNNASVVRPGIDALKIAVFAEDGVSYLYPIEGGEFYVDLVSPLNTSYIMPSAAFVVGDRDELSVTFLRNGTGNAPAAADMSFRDFRAKLRMVDSYPGFASLSFPQGTPANKTSATADFDGDGVNNLSEYNMEFPTAELIANAFKNEGQGDNGDLAKVLSFPTTHIPVVQDPTVKVPFTWESSIDEDGHVICKVQKRPLSGLTLTPTFQVQIPSTSSVKRFKKIKFGPGQDWDLEVNMTADDPPVPDKITPDPQGEPAPTTVSMRVQRTNPVTGITTVAVEPVTVTLSKSYWILRSKDPVADPTQPAPEFKVTIAPTALK